MEERERRLLTRWIRELRVITIEVRSLMLASKVFWEVQKILTANSAALCHRLFNEWMATNYGNATAIGIRRQLDEDSGSVSFKRLLLQIQAGLVCHSDMLSRENFVANYPPMLRCAGDSQFDRLVGANEARVEVAYIDRDLDTLDTATKGVRRFANKRIAHRDARDIQNRRLGELDQCLETFAEMIDRYSHILTGSGTSVVPELPPDWKCVFKVAWIKQQVPKSG
jgi:hypothetical protein